MSRRPASEPIEAPFKKVVKDYGWMGYFYSWYFGEAIEEQPFLKDRYDLKIDLQTVMDERRPGEIKMWVLGIGKLYHPQSVNTYMQKYYDLRQILDSSNVTSIFLLPHMQLDLSGNISKLTGYNVRLHSEAGVTSAIVKNIVAQMVDSFGHTVTPTFNKQVLAVAKNDITSIKALIEQPEEIKKWLKDHPPGSWTEEDREQYEKLVDARRDEIRMAPGDPERDEWRKRRYELNKSESAS